MAIEDNYVRKNLFDFQLSEVIEDDSKTKTALSKVQETRLLDLYSHASDAGNARSGSMIYNDLYNDYEQKYMEISIIYEIRKEMT